MKNNLICENLVVEVGGTQALKGIDLECDFGCTVIMGPNGSGKSSLASAIAGKSLYEIKSGQIMFCDQVINQLSPFERAKLGIFLAYQEPLELVGVTFKEMFSAIEPPITQRNIDKASELAELDYVTLANRVINQDMSGGEKKRAELFTMLVLQPKLVILDEIDSGLDVDGLSLIKKAVSSYLEENPDATVVAITHYPNLANELKPNTVFVLKDGLIKAKGGSDLIAEIKNSGYEAF